MKFRIICFCTREIQIKQYMRIWIVVIIILSGCSSKKKVIDQWEQRVDGGEYGWIDLNTLNYRNLDIPPEFEKPLDEEIKLLYQSNECAQFLSESEGDVEIIYHFMIDRTGKLKQLIRTRGPHTCGKELDRFVSRMKFSPGYKNGCEIPVVAKYSIVFRLDNYWKFEKF